MRVLAVVLLFAALCCYDAARVQSNVLSISDLDFKPTAANIERWVLGAGDMDKSYKDKTAYMGFHFTVDPVYYNDFIDAWHKMERETIKEEGVIFYDLKKPTTDNIKFVGYGEWKDFRCFMDHFKSKYVQDFIDALNDHDIEFHMVPMYRPEVAELNPKSKRMHKKEQIHVMTTYIVPPSVHKEFLDMWDRTEKQVEAEKGAHTYSLRKVWGDNAHYFAYGTWERMEDLHQHFESSHVKELHRGLDKHGIVWKMAPLHKVGSQPE